MKTKEFIKRAEALGYNVEQYKHEIDVNRHHADGSFDTTIATVSTRFAAAFSTDFNVEVNLRLLGVLYEYATTPIEDREEELRYHLRALASFVDPDYGYLNWMGDHEGIIFSNKGDAPGFKTLATKKKWEEWTGCSWEQLMQWFKPEPLEEAEE